MASCFVVGLLEIRFTKPPIAPAPYSVDEDPLINSICFKSSGGILVIPKPPLNPSYNGNPSLNICVYLPSNP